jgi:hypothetical protein
VVWYAVFFELCFPRFGCPCLEDSIVVLIVANRDVLVYVVAHRFGLCMELQELFVCLGFLLLLGLLKLFLLLKQIISILLGLLLSSNLLLYGVDLGSYLGRLVLRAAVICSGSRSETVLRITLGLCLTFEIGNDLIYNLDWGASLLLGLADFLCVKLAAGTGRASIFEAYALLGRRRAP